MAHDYVQLKEFVSFLMTRNLLPEKKISYYQSWISMESFYDDIAADGYHIFSRTRAKIKGFYPNQFPDYPGAKLSELSVGDHITIRVFFPVGSGTPPQVDGGYIDLEIEHVDEDNIFAVIQTQLPENFALSTGDSIEIREDEILSKTETQAH